MFLGHWLDKCLTSPVSEATSTRNMVNVPTTVEICIRAPLSYSSITAKEIEREKVALIDMANLGTAC